jgi:tRNA modification GTPase
LTFDSSPNDDEAQREAAIVTPQPGTTRDVLEVSLDLGGLPITICDTAGLRHTTDLVESIGVKRATDA